MEVLVTDVLTLANEEGIAVPITVNGNTQFSFRTPSNAPADAAPIGTGAAFLGNMVRGFKAHVIVVDPLANPLVAQTVNIKTAAFSGSSRPLNSTSFICTHNFHTAGDDYNGQSRLRRPAIRLTAKTLMGIPFWDSNGGASLFLPWWTAAPMPSLVSVLLPVSG